MPAKTFPAMVELTDTYIIEAARETGEPEWLAAWRGEAWRFFAEALPPEWRRTNLTNLNPETIEPHATSQGTAIQWDETLASKGVIFTSLAAAVRNHEQQVRERLGQAIPPLSHKFSALRAALWQDGVFLYVPRNVALEVPLRVCYTLADGSRSIFPYSLVVLEPGATLTFIEEYTSHHAPEPALAGPTTEMFLGEGARLRYVTVQQWGENVYHIGGQVQEFGANAESEWVSVALGGHTQHLEAEARMKGDGSSVRWLGATFANQQQHLLTAPSLRHMGGHTTSQLDFRTIVTDEGYSVFDGMIKIDHDSSDTTTRLEEHSIHLTPTARSDSIPGLKIDTNNVASAGHASTSGQVDEEQLFYMRSRGIRPDDAIRIIVSGFLEPALEAIPVEEIRETLATAIEEKI
jgi:Fe-S cluster assembly protein SufD